MVVQSLRIFRQEPGVIFINTVNGEIGDQAGLAVGYGTGLALSHF